MNAHWTFESGHLVARNLAGIVLWAWQADEAMGRPLAQAQDLSCRLLPPWSSTQGTQPEEAAPQK